MQILARILKHDGGVRHKERLRPTRVPLGTFADKSRRRAGVSLTNTRASFGCAAGRLSPPALPDEKVGGEVAVPLAQLPWIDSEVFRSVRCFFPPCLPFLLLALWPRNRRCYGDQETNVRRRSEVMNDAVVFLSPSRIRRRETAALKN
ncbi:hypothetical protein GW17_00032392 [Ensete ventricosum]|nr:hypothetical protein GW17_00032392 [Ensete ventricosum]